jgi:hypothetical protein
VTKKNAIGSGSKASRYEKEMRINPDRVAWLITCKLFNEVKNHETPLFSQKSTVAGFKP